MLSSAGYSADLQVVASPDQLLVTPLRQQELTIVVSNNGPETVNDVSVTGRTVNLALVLISIANPERCPGASIDVSGGNGTFRWQPGTLGSGQALSCALRFRAASGAPTGNLLYVVDALAPGNVDGNSFNNASRTLLAYSGIDAPTDTRISARLDPGGILRIGMPQRLHVSVTNIGMTTVPAVTILSPGYTQVPLPEPGFVGYDLFELSETAPCFMIVDAEPPFVFFVAFGFDDAPLPPGASRTCTIGIRALPGALGVGAAELSLEMFPRGPGVYDIAPQDNTALVRVDFGSIGVPRAVPLSAIAWFILATLIAVLSARRLVRLPTPRQ